jgi:DDE superfamily endonuclease
MPRTYRRKTDNGLIPPEAMHAAVLSVVEGQKLRKVASETGIPKSALARYVQKYKRDELCSMQPNYRHSQIFTYEQETVLAEYLTTCSAMFHGLTPKRVRSLAYEMAVKNSIICPQTWHDSKMSGADWFNAFLKRHPQLSIRCPEATSIARATAFNEQNIKAFFDVLEPVIKRINASGKVIFNLDETGCTTVQKVPKVVAQKGCKQVGQVTSRERGELVTMCSIISATGVGLPPVFIFPRKNFREVFMTGAPEGSLGLANDSGWMTGENFVKVLQHVAKYTHTSASNEIILVMDNHESHIALDSLIYAKEHGINIVTLPPHTSNKTQPLDISVFGPLKSYFNAFADSWLLKNPGKTISIYQMAELMGNAWQKAATPSNILSGFRVPGIWPLDRHAFSSQGYLPSSVTDRPLPSCDMAANTSTPDSSRPITVAINLMNSETEAGILSKPVSAAVIASTSSNNESDSPTTSGFISPQQFRGYPKVRFVSICLLIL